MKETSMLAILTFWGRSDMDKEDLRGKNEGQNSRPTDAFCTVQGIPRKFPSVTGGRQFEVEETLGLGFREPVDGGRVQFADFRLRFRVGEAPLAGL